MSVSRRTLLRSLGWLAPGLALPSLVRAAPRVRAQTPPRRLLVFMTHHGKVPDLWRPSARDVFPNATVQTTDFELPPLAAPLVPFQRDLLWLGGLSMVSAERETQPVDVPHFSGMAHMLTGTPMFRAAVAPNTAGGISLDQYLARALRTELGVRTPLPFLALRNSLVTDALDRMAFTFAGPAEPVRPDADALRTFDRLFPGSAPGPSLVDRLAQRRSVLDFVANRVSKVDRANLSEADRRRLVAHEEAIREVETSISGLSEARCTGPDRNALEAGAPAPRQAYELTGEAMFQLATHALRCDLTRVVTLQLAQIPGAELGITEEPHDLIHSVPSREPGGYEDLSPLPYGRRLEVVTAYHLKVARMFARLLELLASAEEADGSRLLDHTLVLWCTDVGNGAFHGLSGLPWIIAGGSAGGWRTGRYVHFPEGSVGDGPAPTGPASRKGYVAGTPHNRLLLSIARSFGLPLETFGDAQFCKDGPLPLLA